MARCAGQHPEHTLGRGWNDGQAVGPAALEARFDLVFEIAELDAPRCQTLGTEARRQLVGNAGFERIRATADAPLGQSVAQVRDAGERAPLGADPALYPTLRLAIGHLEQCRYDFDTQAIGHF